MKTCDLCPDPLPDDQWRFVCPACGFTIHYRCLEGGVPVHDRAQLVCPCDDCDGTLRGVESAKAAEAAGQQSLL